MIDFVHKWGGERSGLSQLQIVGWVGIARSKFYDWRQRYGKANEHNAWIPRDHWIEDWERDRNRPVCPTVPDGGLPKAHVDASAARLWHPGGLLLRRSLSRSFPAPRLKEFVRLAGLTHVKTSPYYPQSNGKIERWHKSLKNDGIRPSVPLDIEQARRSIGHFVEHYNTVRPPFGHRLHHPAGQTSWQRKGHL